jgi:hypothetical protein
VSEPLQDGAAIGPAPRAPAGPRPGLTRAATVVLPALAALALLLAAAAGRAHHGAAAVIAPLVAAVLLGAALGLAPARRVVAAAAALLVTAGALGAEVKAGRASPRDGSAAAARGVVFDTRNVWEVVHAERGSGAEATASIEPHRVLGRAGAAIDGGHGVMVVPLGGIAGKKTVLCNEGGAFAIYESDEHGFNNPPGLWSGSGGALEVGIVGEAFLQGACVPAGKGAADVVRSAHPRTLDLAQWGNGPLVDLAGIMEYLVELRPRHVLWVHYHNDLAALDAELASPLLRRYLDNPGHRQGLAARQGAIDEALAAIAAEDEAEARGWPGALGAVGLTRARTPMWLGDLIMGEQHATAGAALRLDKLHGFLGARLARKKAEPAPDLAAFKRILEKARATVDGWGGKLHFVYLADLHHLRGPEHPTRKAVLETVRAVGLPLIDLQPVFAATADPMTLRYHAESHLNEEGNALVGRAMVAGLHRP